MQSFTCLSLPYVEPTTSLLQCMKLSARSTRAQTHLAYFWTNHFTFALFTSWQWKATVMVKTLKVNCWTVFIECPKVVSEFFKILWGSDYRKEAESLVISPLQDFLTSTQSIFLLHLRVQDSSVSHKITASWGSWPVQTPAAGGDAVCLAHSSGVCGGRCKWDTEWRTIDGGKKTFINIPVPKEGVVTGDVLKPTLQTQGDFPSSWME